MNDSEAGVRPDLDAVRKGRSAIADAMLALEDALASPSTPSAVFIAGVREALASLVSLGVEQLDSLEDTGGLLDDVVLTAPRLSDQVDAVRSQRDDLRGHLSELERAAEAVGEGAGDAHVLRRAGLRLLGEVALYRQRIADLVYEAYFVDLGGHG